MQCIYFLKSHNKVLQTGHLQTAKISCFPVRRLEVYNHHISRARLSLQALQGKDPFLILQLLVVARTLQCYSACRSSSFPSLSPSTLGLLPSVSVRLCFLIKTFVIEFKVHHHPVELHLNLITKQRPYFQTRSHSQVPGGTHFGDSQFNSVHVC